MNMKNFIEKLDICINEFKGTKNINLRCARWYNKVGFVYDILFPEVANWERGINNKKRDKLRAIKNRK